MICGCYIAISGAIGLARTALHVYETERPTIRAPLAGAAWALAWPVGTIFGVFLWSLDRRERLKL